MTPVIQDTGYKIQDRLLPAAVDCHRWLSRFLLLCSIFLAEGLEAAEARFPRPDFVSGYESPPTLVPTVESLWWGWLDVGLLLFGLILAALLVLRWRSRKGLVLLALGAVLYFGFFRKGCICPVGSVQNVCFSIADSTYVIPAGVVLLFVLPLLFALFFGRVFCAGVCPLGAIQELVVVKHLSLPPWLNRILGAGRYWFLGIAVFAAATGTGFLICRYDPLVGVFRLGGGIPALAIALCVLAVGMFICRPYCRFLCPFAVLLEWGSRLSWKRASITPGECVSCRLCESSCPYGAIDKPETGGRRADREAPRQMRILLLMLILLPVLAIGGYLLGEGLGIGLSKLNPAIQMADLITGAGETGLWQEQRLEAFEASGTSRQQVLDQARATYSRLRVGGRWLGAYCGVVLGLHLVRFSRRRTHTDYRTDPGLCLSCGRCFRYCPVEAPK